MILFNILEFKQLFWVIGIIVSLVFYVLTSNKFGLKMWQGLCIGLINLVVLSIGAKIMYLIEQWKYVAENGVSFTGFSLFGALFFLPLAIYIDHLIFKKSNFSLGSFTIVPVLIMLMLYRFDCLNNGCCGGIEIGDYKVPTQIIEIVFCAIVIFVFYYLELVKKMINGETYVWFFVLYGFFRFILEFFRERDYIFSIISISHIWSILSIVLGVVLLVIRRKVVKNEETK